MEKSHVVYEQEAERESKLDNPIKAVCACGKDTKALTYRTLKNKWPYCSCNMPMKILTDNAS